MYEACAAVPSLQEYLATLTAVHSGERAYRGRYRSDDGDRSCPVSEHPVVRTHPISGRRALYVNSGFTVCLKELTRRESGALLRLLFDHSPTGSASRFASTGSPTRWRWDNRCVQHHAAGTTSPRPATATG
jgi:taurine dioxygenase